MSKKELRVLITKATGQEYIKFLEGLDLKIKPVYLEDMVNNYMFDHTMFDIALFSGGADVNPNHYNEKLGKHTSISKDRDNLDRYMFDKCRTYKKPMLGICRGAQFLTVMNGGRLIQHVNNHTSDHEMSILGGGTITVTSTHHQMMYPYDLNEDSYRIIGWSRYFKATTYLNGRNEEMELDPNFLEPEVILYEKTNSLAIQGHPEMSGANEKFKTYSLKLIKDNLL